MQEIPHRTFFAMTVLPSAAPRWRSLTSSLLPSLKACCTHQGRLVRETSMCKVRHANILPQTSQHLQCTESKVHVCLLIIQNIWILYECKIHQRGINPTDLVKATCSKWTSAIPIFKVPAINVTAHRDPGSVIAYTGNQHCNFKLNWQPVNTWHHVTILLKRQTRCPKNPKHNQLFISSCRCMLGGSL